MLIDETFPRFLRRNPALDGGHHREGFSFGDFESSDSVLLGRHHEEIGEGSEKCTVCKGLGEPVEAIVTDEEVKVCYDKRVMAIYERASGILVCASFSLAQAFLEESRNDIRMDQVMVREMKELLRGGNDLVVVIKLGEDGEGRGTVVLSDRAGVCRPLAAARMIEPFRIWRCISPIGRIDFCVGIGVLALDLGVVNPYTGERASFNVAQELDFSILDRERINPRLVLDLAAGAFPGMDLV